MNENLPLPTPVNKWLDEATAALSAVGIHSARLDAELILAHTLRVGRTTLHAHPDILLTDRQEDIANARLALRIDRVPIAYIIGHKEFYGRRFYVNSATLIPRPESEALIELLHHAVPSRVSLLPHAPLQLVDVGTGSGILGITAALLYPDELSVTLVDISRQALAVAQKNATAHHAAVSIQRSDLLDNYPLTATIIIANLPYVDPQWERSPETNHEPAEALFAQHHGVALMNKLIHQTRTSLAIGGSLILEADPTQHEALTATAKTAGLVLRETNGYGLLFEKLK